MTARRTWTAADFPGSDDPSRAADEANAAEDLEEVIRERDRLRVTMNAASSALWNALGQPPGEISLLRMVDMAAERLTDLAVIGVAVASEAGTLDVDVNARTYADALAVVLRAYHAIRAERDNLAGTVELCCLPVEGEASLCDRVRAAGEDQRRVEKIRALRDRMAYNNASLARAGLHFHDERVTTERHLAEITEALA